ncbi:DCC1-like thiol-disulfide oxidoreductase family protein [Halorussus halobius]|uniref:DCC1-like thiol-disulfide oxidoreductase family protein n=1 Tax=Halorussus halobius TaxID=1710537 RepID=UPI001091E116|nr:DCC1-like thiol-disulfide oxidoreductase family protein [Halorussus halobius]
MSDATLVYDDDCGFCTWWADFFAYRSDLRLVGFSDLSDDLRERLPDDYEECSHVVTDDEVYSCGQSLEEAFVRSDLGEDARPLVEFLRNFEDYRGLRERVYRTVADNRTEFGRIVWKTPPARESDDR